MRKPSFSAIDAETSVAYRVDDGLFLGGMTAVRPQSAVANDG